MNDKTITEEVRETTIHKISQDFNQKTRINTSCQTISRLVDAEFRATRVFVILPLPIYNIITGFYLLFLVSSAQCLE